MSKERAKGTSYESAFVSYLREHGFPHVERRAMSGSRDRGDIAGLIGWVGECKATNRIDLSTFMNEAEREADHAGCTNFFLTVKRRQCSIANGYFIVPNWLGVELLRAYEEVMES